MPARKLKEFLDANRVPYETIAHTAAYTALETASMAHVKGQDLAKTVMVKIDAKLAMAVLPASHHVDLAALKVATGAGFVRLASEVEFRNRFPECDVGAMPPFGNLYDLPVYVEESLTQDKKIAFAAGSHNELIKLAYEDFARLVRPVVARFREVKAA